ncbi:hypothetical protein [Methylobacterium nodulans]|uniref:Uncharacterized protein n=1 Tax=Methylobacterium nodulans (strain LMG 21967 / CNCM I-2342 / ORS 2060) TaxID=460265 RepID=B8IJT9_METNO|nr:hypothetical protein [Methylobacterium nodulans]ACL58137.1 conserved hypothetical protein [Methylobacterium nodulans ORS 2060]
MSDSPTLDVPSPTVLEWGCGLAGLSPGQPAVPSGFRPDEWVETLANGRRFVDDFGPQVGALRSS